MTAYFQDPPELISALVRTWEAGCENVYMVVSERQSTGLLRTFDLNAFYWPAGKLKDGRIPRNPIDVRLVDRKRYETINALEERNRFVRGLIAWVGYRSIGIEHERPPRFGGVSNAHSLKVLDLALKRSFAHSYVPLRLITISGFMVSVAVPDAAAARSALRGPRSALRRLRQHRRLQAAAIHDDRCRQRVRRTDMKKNSPHPVGDTVRTYLPHLRAAGTQVRIFNTVKPRPNYVVRERVGLGTVHSR